MKSWEKRVMVECKAVIDLGVRRYYGMDDHQYERDLRAEAAELVQFLRDHRSRDAYGIDIEPTYEILCRFCGYASELDSDTGAPLCCRKANETWEAEEFLIACNAMRTEGSR